MSDEKQNSTVATVRVRATVPQISFEEVFVDMPEELFEMGNEEEKAKFVWDSLTQREQDWCPQGFKGYLDCLEVNYSTIKKV